jgi:Holliday junction resolvase RusA-like endonuclease
MKKYEIKIEGTPWTWNKFINRTHWTYYAYKKTVQFLVRIALREQVRIPDAPLSQVRLDYRIGYPTKRLCDITDLCLKPHTDSLVSAGLIRDDNRYVVPKINISWEESKEGFTKITITEI